MVAVVLAEEPCRLRGIPEISDVQVVSGLEAPRRADRLHRPRRRAAARPHARRAGPLRNIDTHAGSSRVPVLLCGPLLHRLGEAFIPDLRGCRIGERPINYHLDVLRQFGAEIEKRQDGLRLTAPRGRPARPTSTCPSRASAPPSRCCSPRSARAAATTLRNAAIEPDHRPHRDPAEDGRPHLGADRPGHHRGGRRPAGRVRPPGDPRPHRGRVVGLRRARHGRRRLRPRGAAAADDAVPQRVPPDRGCVRRRRRGHPVLAPRGRPQRDRDRDRRPPGS